MIKLNFETCLKLLLQVKDQSVEPEDFSLLTAKFKHWQKQISIVFFQPDKNVIFNLPVYSCAPRNFYNGIRVDSFSRIIKQGYVLIYLSSIVEQEVDLIWQQNPSKAWLLAGLAQTICRAAATEVLGPQACLPLPAISQELAQFMNKAKMLKAGRLNYKFALFSFYPAQETCSFCSLKENCPKI